MMQAPTLEELSKHWQIGEDISQETYLHGFYWRFEEGGAPFGSACINEKFPPVPGSDGGGYYVIREVLGQLEPWHHPEEPKHAPEP